MTELTKEQYNDILDHYNSIIKIVCGEDAVLLTPAIMGEADSNNILSKEQFKAVIDDVMETMAKGIATSMSVLQDKLKTIDVAAVAASIKAQT